jgi:hypothetical protein
VLNLCAASLVAAQSGIKPIKAFGVCVYAREKGTTPPRLGLAVADATLADTGVTLVVPKLRIFESRYFFIEVLTKGATRLCTGYPTVTALRTVSGLNQARLRRHSRQWCCSRAFF